MAWSYNNLWHMLIDKGIKKSELIKLAHLNSTAISKMGKGFPVTMDTLGKLCQALNCNIEDIVQYVRDKD